MKDIIFQLIVVMCSVMFLGSYFIFVITLSKTLVVIYLIIMLCVFCREIYIQDKIRQ